MTEIAGFHRQSFSFFFAPIDLQHCSDALTNFDVLNPSRCLNLRRCDPYIFHQGRIVTKFTKFGGKRRGKRNVAFWVMQLFKLNAATIVLSDRSHEDWLTLRDGFPRVLMKLCPCESLQRLQYGQLDMRKDLPRAGCASPAARSNLSHSKKLPIALLLIFILRSRAMIRTRTNSRLKSFNSGYDSVTLREAKSDSTCSLSMSCVFSKAERSSREARQSLDFFIMVRVSVIVASRLSISPCSVNMVSSSFLSRAGASA